jgi:uncharacterized membrane protein HdeD (DUF308 family)
MEGAMWGTMIDGFISIGAGLVACYYGFNSPPVSGDAAMTAKWQQWHQAWGKWVKIGGVCLVLFGVFTIVTALR